MKKTTLLINSDKKFVFNKKKMFSDSLKMETSIRDGKPFLMDFDRNCTVRKNKKVQSISSRALFTVSITFSITYPKESKGFKTKIFLIILFKNFRRENTKRFLYKVLGINGRNRIEITPNRS